MLLPVVMAGGTGSRLWPLSRELQPKQFLSFHQGGSMLQNTITRLDGLAVAAPLVICNEEHRFLVAEQLRQLNKLADNIILEPVGRNTAPAITLAALHAIAGGEDPILLVLAADHLIADSDAFRSVVNHAIPFAQHDKLVTFGIVPKQPETGYGYIQRGDVQQSDGSSAWKIKCFVEKPDRETAEKYLESGEYLWNSGMFMFRASVYLNEVSKFCPEILDVCQRSMAQSVNDLNFIKLNKDIFTECPSDSIDYAVMEHTESGIVAAMDAGWNDIVPGLLCGKHHQGIMQAMRCKVMFLFIILTIAIFTAKTSSLLRWDYRIWSLLIQKTRYWYQTKIVPRTLRLSSTI